MEARNAEITLSRIACSAADVRDFGRGLLKIKTRAGFIDQIPPISICN
jgi:hypothetical protein